MKRTDGRQIFGDVMKELTNRAGLCSYLCIWGSNGPTVIRSEMGNVQTAARVRIGSNLSVLTATGMIFPSFMPPESTRELLIRDIVDWNRESANAQASVEKSMHQLDRVKKARIARTRGMRNPTWTAFSSPVFDPNGNFQMALTVIGVTTHFDTRLNGPVADQLKASAEQLSAHLIF